MLVQWLFNGCHHALCPPFSASSMNADAAAVSVSSPMSFGRFAVIVLLATPSSHRMERSQGFHQSEKKAATEKTVTQPFLCMCRGFDV